MTPLRSVLATLAERPDVAGAAVMSDEGLVIASSLPDPFDADAVAAFTVSAYRALEALAGTVRHGTVDEAVISSSGGAMVLVRLGAGSTLLLLATPDGDLGALLHEVRRHGPTLAALT